MNLCTEVSKVIYFLIIAWEWATPMKHKFIDLE